MGNNDRLSKQKKQPITVIVGNPPYSSGQDSANDNNQNEKYPSLDEQIASTYAANSTATNKNSLYDSYIRAIKWATLRLRNNDGVIAYVSNGGFLDSNTADGLRKSLAEEFSDVYIYNLRGNQRTSGELSRREGGKIFDAGSRATVAVTVLVRKSSHEGPARIHYHDIGDYLDRKEKLSMICEAKSIAGLDMTVITPNEHGDWLGHRSEDFLNYVALGVKPKKGEKMESSIFQLYGRGLLSGRDAWVYNYSRSLVVQKNKVSMAFYNHEVERYQQYLQSLPKVEEPTPVEDFISYDDSAISWDRQPKKDVARGRLYSFKESGVRVASYRPFCRQHVYFDRQWNNTIHQMHRVFPTPAHENCGYTITGVGSHYEFCLIAAASLPDLHLLDTGQFFSRWTYEKVIDNPDEGTLLGLPGEDSCDDTVDGYRKVDNITDESLARFQAAYGDEFSKGDIFHYVYGLLHASDYRKRFAVNLKKTLPRIPLVEEAIPFVEAGKNLMELHLNYDSVAPYSLEGLGYEVAEADSWEYFRVEKMKFTRVRVGGKLMNDRSAIVYNQYITLSGIPEDAYRYQLGSKSAIEWVMDRYQVKTDKKSGIVNDPNDWSKEVGNPRYILDLLARIATVSLETMKIVDALPPLAIRSDQ